MNKKKIIEIIEDLRNDMNKTKADEILNKVKEKSEEELLVFLEGNNIKTEEEVRTKLHAMLYSRDFKPLNDLISYGRSENTLHIHVVPKDASSLLSRNGFAKAQLSLIDALEKLKGKMSGDSEYSNIKDIYAVSGLIRKPITKWFELLGFDVKTMKIDEAKNDKELRAFYDRFKNQRQLGRAVLEREKILSDEWEEQKNKRKIELQQELSKNKRIVKAVEVGEKTVSMKNIESAEKNIDKQISERTKEKDRNIGGE